MESVERARLATHDAHVVLVRPLAGRQRARGLVLVVLLQLHRSKSQNEADSGSFMSRLVGVSVCILRPCNLTAMFFCVFILTKQCDWLQLSTFLLNRQINWIGLECSQSDCLVKINTQKNIAVKLQGLRMHSHRCYTGVTYIFHLVTRG